MHLKRELKQNDFLQKVYGVNQTFYRWLASDQKNGFEASTFAHQLHQIYLGLEEQVLSTKRSDTGLLIVAETWKMQECLFLEEFVASLMNAELDSLESKLEKEKLFGIACSVMSNKSSSRLAADSNSPCVQSMTLLACLAQHRSAIFADTLFDNVLLHIMALANESGIQVRAKALRLLGELAMSDPSVFEKLVVQNALTSRIHDPASSVRDVALDIVGRHLMASASKDAMNLYYDAVSARVLVSLDFVQISCF